MRNLNISNDIIPVGEFKAGMKKYLLSIQDTHHPIVITQNGKPAGVLISPEDYDNLVHNKLFLESISKGLSDAENGNLFSSNQVLDKLKQKREIR